MKGDQRSNQTYQKQIPANNSTTKIIYILGNFKHHACIQQTCFLIYFQIRGATQNFQEFARNNMNTYFQS